MQVRLLSSDALAQGAFNAAANQWSSVLGDKKTKENLAKNNAQKQFKHHPLRRPLLAARRLVCLFWFS